MKKPFSLRKLVGIAVAVIMTLTLAGTAFAGTGNNAPTGTHFNLNIIGVQNAKDAMGVKQGGNVIFVELYSSKQGKVRVATDINLTAAPTGESFYVIDGNGTDGEAEFQLPEDVATEWTVWARTQGKPGGSANVTTCAQDGTDDYVCNVGTVFLREKGNKPFENVTNDLLYLDATVPLFDTAYYDYFWSYQNNGLKLLQLRFYPAGSEP